MDIPRPSVARQKRIRRTIFAVAGLLVLVLVTVGLAQLKPAAPTVELGSVWPDTVKRGSMLRQVRGPGTLVPEDIRWIPAARPTAASSGSSRCPAPSSNRTPRSSS